MTRSFVPCPADVSPEILAAQARPILPQNSREFEDLLRRTEEKARRIFHTENQVLQLPWGDQEIQEAALRNLVEHKILICANGALGERWLETAAACSKPAGSLEAEWGQPVQAEKLRQELTYGGYDSVLFVHVEPSTGVENPLAELCQVVRDTSPDALILVDAFASLGGVSFDIDALDLDFVWGPSCTCLGLPPGLSFVILSRRAIEKAAKIPARGHSLDLVAWEKAARRAVLPTIFPTSLLYAWDVQSDAILTAGLEERYQRYAGLSEKIRAWVTANGFNLAANPSYQSTTVHCIFNDKSWSIPDVIQRLLQQGLRIDNGLSMFKDRTFRVALMGEITDQDLDLLLTALAGYRP